MINTWFTFKGKIQNDSKVIAFKKNYTDDADDGTKSNMSLLGRGGRHNKTDPYKRATDQGQGYTLCIGLLVFK